jgi:hypothetical protein
MLSERERDELLIRLDDRVERIRKDQENLKAAMESDEGFTRCQLHAQKVSDIEQSLKRTKRGALAAIISIAIKFVFDKAVQYWPG